MYEDLLSLPSEAQPQSPLKTYHKASEADIVEYLSVLNGAEERLSSMRDTIPESISPTHAAQFERGWIHCQQSNACHGISSETPIHRRILYQAMDMLGDNVEVLDQEEDVRLRQVFPVGLLEIKEWEALVKLSVSIALSVVVQLELILDSEQVHSGDGITAEQSLNLIKVNGIQ
jgi:hypothetical protein